MRFAFSNSKIALFLVSGPQMFLVITDVHFYLVAFGSHKISQVTPVKKIRNFLIGHPLKTIFKWVKCKFKHYLLDK